MEVSISDFLVSGDTLKGIVVLARKRPFNYAFNPGKSPQEHVLGLDKRKASNVIGKSVKSAGPGAKVSHGSFFVDGKVVTLTTETPLPALAKKVKAFLRLNKLKLNVVVQDPDGTILDQDIEDLPDADDQPPPLVDIARATDELPLATVAEALHKKADDLEQIAADLPDAKREKIGSVLQQARELIENQGFEKARTILGKVEAALQGGAAPDAPTQPTEILLQKHADLSVRIAALGESPAKEKLTGAIETLATLINAGDLKQAAKLVLTLQAALQRIPAAASPTPDTPPPAADAPRRAKALAQKIAALSDPGRKAALSQELKHAILAIKAQQDAAAQAALDRLDNRLSEAAAGSKLLPLWQTAREHVDAQISALQTALQDHGATLFARIADKGLNGMTGTQLVGMQARLMDYDAAPSSEARMAASPKLVSALSEMRAFLDTDQGVALLERNPLGVEITLRKTLGAAVDDLSSRLPA